MQNGNILTFLLLFRIFFFAKPCTTNHQNRQKIRILSLLIRTCITSVTPNAILTAIMKSLTQKILEQTSIMHFSLNLAIFICPRSKFNFDHKFEKMHLLKYSNRGS